jgi:RNA ligase-like protein
VNASLASYHSYPKVFAMGHSAILNILKDPVVVQEKVDGSQFSFGVYLNDAGVEEVRCRSKGAQINIDAPEKMFDAAVAQVMARRATLHVGWTYRSEYLSKPKHNVLAYERTPKDNLVVFDIGVGHEVYAAPSDVAAEAARIGLEVVPTIHDGPVDSMEFFRSLLERQSILGGQKIEGVVVKNYKRFSVDGHVMMGKFVSEAFKEVHDGDWRERNPRSGDILDTLTEKYRSPARWAKALQRLREAGQLEDSPRDIGKLMRSVPPDVEAECKPEIERALWAWAWPHIARKSVAGLPEWYKDELLKRAFNTKE